MKKIVIGLIILSACTSADNSNKSNQSPIDNKDSEAMPLSYEDMQKQLQGDSAGDVKRQAYELDRQWSIYRDIYPEKKLSKNINDFSGLDSVQLHRAYLNFSLVMSHYQDSGKTYLPFFKNLYGALDKRMEDLESGNELLIKDKLRITRLKSDINSAIAEIEMKTVTK